MKKTYLMTPGPTPVPPDVSLAMAAPIIHHRSTEYSEIFEEVRKDLKYLFQTENDVLIFTSSGTGAMEGAVTNMLSRGDKAIIIRGGKFGERWGEICESYGVNIIPIDVPWGKAVKPEEVASCLEADREIKAVFMQASETSTGVMYPTREIADIVKKYENTLMIVDAITGLGVFNLPADTWNLDVVVAGSQKALMLPPGLSFASISEKAWKFAETSNLPKYYFDFKKERESQKKNQNAYTPAVSLIIGLYSVLKTIKKEGLKNLFNRHINLAEATRAAICDMGLELFSVDSPTPSLTAVKIPSDVDGARVVKILREKYGIRVAGGQGDLKGKIIRIAHMGFIDEFDIISTIFALGKTLSEVGFKLDTNKGISKFMEVYND
ncbi:MAG: alanine--glyoxylate aminotransferase family protein [Thermodesulfobacteriota bacterium]|nr:alanine--glyoxylate aminotransferase family protein [Thermodesulfobacteriota bacterium]